MRGDTPHPLVPLSAGALWRSCAALLVAAGLVCVAQDGHRPAAQENKPATAVPASGADSQSQPANAAKMSKQQMAAAADGQRKKQIAEESTELLTMALALKAEVDKTTKDTLSLNVIRKADEIEKLAHNVKEKMKQSAGAG